MLSDNGHALFSGQTFYLTCIHLATVAGGYGLAAFFTTEDTFTWGAVFGWWLSLYVGFIVGIKWPVIVPCSIVYVVVLLVDIFMNAGWFYSDGASSNPTGYFMLSLIGLPILVSPILVNELVRRLQKQYMSLVNRCQA